MTDESTGANVGKQQDKKGDDASLANNPFALLLQPPSPYPPAQSEPTVTTDSQSQSSSSHPGSQAEPTIVRTYLDRLQNQISFKTATVSISQNVKFSRQRTLYDISGYPIASPIRTLDSVLSWEPGHDDICVSTIPLKQRTSSLFDQPNVLVCHDMMGGYTNDRFVQGHAVMQDYNIYHWQHVSMFVYFSHNFITIPPPCWTNSAHKNGVLSLGTVITEWQDGARLCARLLSSEDNVQLFVQNLIGIAVYYKFDGWLVNIENPIHPDHMANLYMMLSLLTTGMHGAIPGSKVIWYDSVTSEGELRWQSCLNEKNESFFALCDSIFLDYHWTPDRLHQARSFAGDRSADVYVGVDVFGRDRFYGGGGFGCNTALLAINEAGLSTAIFAPGWVYENLDKEEFLINQDRFWSLLAPHCPVHPITSVPLVCSFSRGYGKKVAIDGRVVYESTWANLSSQDIQPSFPDQYFKNTRESSIQLHDVGVNIDHAYNNGGSLRITGTITSSHGKPANVRLFKTDCLSLAEPLLVSYTYHDDERLGHMVRLRTDSDLKFILLQPDVIGKDDGVVLHTCGLPVAQNIPLPTQLNMDSAAGSHCNMAALNTDYTKLLHCVFTGKDMEDRDEHRKEFWKTSYFVVHSPAHQRSNIRGVSITLYPKRGREAGDVSMTIGELKIMNTTFISATSHPSTIANISYEDMACDTSSGKLSLTLFWDTQDSQHDPIEHVNIYSMVAVDERSGTGWESDAAFIGRAYGLRFRVIKMDVPMGVVRDDGSVVVKFILQPVTVTRQKPPSKSFTNGNTKTIATYHKNCRVQARTMIDQKEK